MVTVPRASKEGRAENRERLLDAAAEVFLARGYMSSTVEQIAEVAGLTTGAVYSNFRSKAELLAAVVSRQSTQDQAEIVRIVDSHDSIEEKARAVGEREGRIAGETAAWTQLIWECRLQALRLADLHAVAAPADGTRAADIGAMVEQELSRMGLTVPAPASQIGMLFLALANGLAFYRLSHPTDVPTELFPLALVALTRGLVDVARMSQT